MVLNDSLYEVGVSKDAKFLEFGSGGLRGPTDVQQATTNNQTVLSFSLNSDNDPVFVTLPDDSAEVLMPLRRVLSTLTIKGFPDVAVPLHTVRRAESNSGTTQREQCPRPETCPPKEP